MPLPAAHILVGAALAEALLPEETAARNRAVLAIACLAIVPDFDFFAIWFFDYSPDWHRSWTHSIAFALVAGVLLWAILGTRRLRESIACALVIASHGILDALTSFKSTGVELLWPFTSARYKLGATDLLEFPFITGRAEHAVAAIVQMTLLEIALFAPLLLAVLIIRRHRLRSARPNG